MKIKSMVLTMLSAAWIASSVYAETVTVTNTNASGAGSLTEAINTANADQTHTDIVFDIPQGGKIITGQAEWLPAITTPVTIDGTNSSGKVILVGSAPNSPGGPVSGLEFLPGSDNSIVKNITTEGFLNAIWIKTHGIEIVNNEFTKAFARAVIVEDSRNSLIENNTFNNNDALSIQISNSLNIKIVENQVNSGSVVVYDSEKILVGLPTRGNTFNNSSIGAEAAVNFYGTGSGATIIGNTFLNLPDVGLSISGVDQKDHTISVNTFKNNKGWDIKLTGVQSPTVYKNSITGDEFAREAGIYTEGVEAPSIRGNTLDGARISLNSTENARVGGPTSDRNTITNDPQGFSGSAGIIMNNSNNCEIVNNEIFENSSNGIIMTGSFNNVIWTNDIHDNGRTGIKIVSGNHNVLGRNKTYNHHADAMGGINSISLLGDANEGKTAPTITSVSRIDENSIMVTGLGNPTDKIEILRSNKPVSPLSNDALEEIGYSWVGEDSTWASQIVINEIQDADLFLTSIATDTADNSSELSNVEGILLVDGISGPLEIERGLAYTYSVKEITGCNYDWWVNGDATVKRQGEHSVDIIFHNIPGSVIPVSVGYQDPEEGWIVERIEVTIK